MHFLPRLPLHKNGWEQKRSCTSAALSTDCLTLNFILKRKISHFCGLGLDIATANKGQAIITIITTLLNLFLEDPRSTSSSSALQCQMQSKRRVVVCLPVGNSSSQDYSRNGERSRECQANVITLMASPPTPESQI
ncbi:hypothetical protein MHYP_G00270290 [Metynnis hypsauchen]